MKRILFAILVLIPGLLLAETQYQEDDPAPNGAIGQVPLCKRSDTAASTAGTDGDLAQCITDGSGRSWVTIGAISPGSNATFAPLDVTAFGAIGAAYASAVNLPDGTKVIVCDNQTNGDVMVSLDGGVSDTMHVKAGDVVTINLASAGLVTTADVQLKDGTTASTAGSFYVYSYK